MLCSFSPIRKNIEGNGNDPTFSASRDAIPGLTLPRHSLKNRMPYINIRSAGPLISKFRKKVLARYKEIISSRQSYDSLSGSMSNSDDPAGSGGSVYAGPRVRVRRGSKGKLPDAVVRMYM